MTGRCSKCKEHCEIVFVGFMVIADDDWAPKHESGCCGAPLLDDGERSHDE